MKNTSNSDSKVYGTRKSNFHVLKMHGEPVRLTVLGNSQAREVRTLRKKTRPDALNERNTYVGLTRSSQKGRSDEFHLYVIIIENKNRKTYTKAPHIKSRVFRFRFFPPFSRTAQTTMPAARPYFMRLVSPHDVLVAFRTRS